LKLALKHHNPNPNPRNSSKIEKKHNGQTQFINTEQRKLKWSNPKSSQKMGVNSCAPEG